MPLLACLLWQKSNVHHPPKVTSLTTLVVEQALTYALAGDSVITVPHWFKDLSMTCWRNASCSQHRRKSHRCQQQEPSWFQCWHGNHFTSTRHSEGQECHFLCFKWHLNRTFALMTWQTISCPQCQDQGVKAVLVGESLMWAKDTAAFIRELLDWPDVPCIEAQQTSIIKITGVIKPVEVWHHLNSLSYHHSTIALCSAYFSDLHTHWSLSPLWCM